MRVIPGSHTAQEPHRDTFAKENILSRGQEVVTGIDEGRAVDIILAPGQMSLHHGRVIHGSAPNSSTDRRIGFNVQYVPTHVKQVVAGQDSAMLVRGVDEYKHFEVEHGPTADLTPDAIVALRETMAERRSAYLYRGADRGPR